jgi:hypothetical protein
MQAGLDLVTSAVCRYQLQFQLDEYLSTLVLNLSKKILINSGSKQTNLNFPACTKPPNVACNTKLTPCLL